MMAKIYLSEEKETLLIPLYGKAKESQKKAPILIDKKAVEIVNQIDYNFNRLKIPKKTNIMMSLRAKLIDNFVKSFLEKGNESVVLHLGCGLDSRYNRIENNNAHWYDIDFKEVIDIRRHFYEETDLYHLISSSVTENKWIEGIPKGKKQYIVIAEGLFMYLKENDIKALINNLLNSIGKFTLIFDAFSVYTAKKIKNHPSIKKTGAQIWWGIDNPAELTKWGMAIKLIQEQYFTVNEEINNLDTVTKTIFKIANLFSAARKAHRLLIYQVG